jgi:hypothetical protein
LQHFGDTENTTGSHVEKKQRKRHISLHGESGFKKEAPREDDSARFKPVLLEERVEPTDGSLSSKQIQDIVSKGYIYRRSKSVAYLADASSKNASFDMKISERNVEIKDVDFNPILELLEDDCIEVNSNDYVTTRALTFCLFSLQFK